MVLSAEEIENKINGYIHKGVCKEINDIMYSIIRDIETIRDNFTGPNNQKKIDLNMLYNYIENIKQSLDTITNLTEYMDTEYIIGD